MPCPEPGVLALSFFYSFFYIRPDTLPASLAVRSLRRVHTAEGMDDYITLATPSHDRV